MRMIDHITFAFCTTVGVFVLIGAVTSSIQGGLVYVQVSEVGPAMAVSFVIFLAASIQHTGKKNE